jgi:hypothetical protein
MSFSNTWAALQTGLRAGTAIENWTQAKGHTGEDFTISKVAPEFIEINAPSASNMQRVSRTDFEAVYEEWPNYMSGQTRRPEIRDKTRFSKYVISILHWLELQSGGVLP